MSYTNGHLYKYIVCLAKKSYKSTMFENASEDSIIRYKVTRIVWMNRLKLIEIKSNEYQLYTSVLSRFI